MLSALYTLAYDDFAYYYKAFCEETGKFVPVHTNKHWLTSLGQWKIDLHQFYECLVRFSCIHLDAPADRWDSASAEVSAASQTLTNRSLTSKGQTLTDDGLTGEGLTSEQVKQLFAEHLEGFPEYVETLVQQYYIATGTSPDHDHQQQQQQLSAAAAPQQQQQQRRSKNGQNGMPSYMQIPGPAAAAAAAGSNVWRPGAAATQQQQQQQILMDALRRQQQHQQQNGVKAGNNSQNSIVISQPAVAVPGFSFIAFRPASTAAAAAAGQQQRARPVMVVPSKQQQHQKRTGFSNTAAAAAAAAQRMLISSGASPEAAAAAAAVAANSSHQRGSSKPPAAPNSTAAAAAKDPAAAAAAMGGSSNRESPEPSGSGTAAAAAAAAPVMKRGRGRPPKHSNGSSIANRLAAGKAAAAAARNAAAAAKVAAVEDPVPGNIIHSVVSWLRTASLELAGPAAEQSKVTSRQKVLAERYNTFVERIQGYRRIPFPEQLYVRFGVKAARRSGRVRTQATFYDSGLYDGESESEEEEIDLWKIQVGSKHQAALPTLQQRPAAPPPAEAKYLSEPIYIPSPAAAADPAQQQQQQGLGLMNQIGSGNALMDAAAAAMHAVQQRAASLGLQLTNSSTSTAAAAGPAAAAAGFNLHTAGGLNPNPGLALMPGEFRLMYQSCSAGEQRRGLLEQWVEKMDTQLGPELVQSLGLSLLGAKLRSTWTAQEEILFGLGMLDKYRKFAHIRRKYLPKRSVHELNGYYYNVWKNNACRLPEEYGDSYTSVTALYDFRYKLCRDLLKIWDFDSMGPIPNAAQLPAEPLPQVMAAAAAAAAVIDPNSYGISSRAAIVSTAAASRAAAKGAAAAAAGGGSSSRGGGRWGSRTPTPPPAAAAAAGAEVTASQRVTSLGQPTYIAAADAAANGGSSQTAGQSVLDVLGRMATTVAPSGVAAATARIFRLAGAAAVPAAAAGGDDDDMLAAQSARSERLIKLTKQWYGTDKCSPESGASSSSDTSFQQQQQQPALGSSRSGAAAAAAEDIPGVLSILAHGSVSRTEARKLAAVAAAAQGAAESSLQAHNAPQAAAGSSDPAAAAECRKLRDRLQYIARHPDLAAMHSLKWHALDSQEIRQQQQQLAAARIALLQPVGALHLAQELNVLAEVVKKGGVFGGVSNTGGVLGKRGRGAAAAGVQ